MQLWKKALITEQEKFEAQQARDSGNSSVGQAQGMKSAAGQAGQDLPAVHRRNPSQHTQKHEVGTLGTSPQKVPNMLKFVKTVAVSGKNSGQVHTNVERDVAAAAEAASKLLLAG